MSIIYRFQIRLNAVERGREAEVMRLLQRSNPGTGTLKWRDVMEQLEEASQVVFNTNSITDAKRMLSALHQIGGRADMVDLIQDKTSQD